VISFALCSKNTKNFSLCGYKRRKENSQSLSNKLFSQWENGATPSDFINANMIELKQTGFMSNRGRQNVASYL
jgi:deoxyribodipyrimidine photo-lyase